jgi:hypothetical protein
LPCSLVPFSLWLFVKRSNFAIILLHPALGTAVQGYGMARGIEKGYHTVNAEPGFGDEHELQPSSSPCNTSQNRFNTSSTSAASAERERRTTDGERSFSAEVSSLWPTETSQSRQQ